MATRGRNYLGYLCQTRKRLGIKLKKKKVLLRPSYSLGDHTGTTHGEAVIVLANLVLDSGVRLRRVQRFVDQIVVTRAVQLVGAALGDQIHDRSAGSAELRGEIAGLNGDFLDRFGRRLRLHGRALQARASGVHRRTVQPRLERVARSSVDDRRNHRAIGAAVGILNTRQKARRRKQIAYAVVGRAGLEQRQVVQLRQRDILHQFAAFGLQQRCFGRYRYFFAGLADLEHHVFTDGLARGQMEFRAYVDLEPRSRHGQIVIADRQLRYEKLPASELEAE